jgi:sugar lactone lactonase YvrE
MKVLNMLLCVATLAIACKKNDDTSPQLPSSALQLVFSDSVYQLTGVAVSREGRMFTNYPLWSDIYKYAAVEIRDSTHSIPYPNAAMNSWQPGDDGMNKWVCVQAVHVDDNNILWVVDPASPKQKGVYQNSQKLVKINLGTNTVEKIYPLAGPTDNQSYANDVRVDTKTQTAYLTNSNEGGIIIVDLVSGKVRQVLQGHFSVTTDPSYTFRVDGREMKKNDAPYKVNSDGIALSPNGQYLYYKPLTDDKLYRIQTAWLKDSSLTAIELGAKVEYLGRFTTTDGMAFDKQGNLYLGDLERYRIMKIDSSLHMTELIKDDRLIWPDSYQVTGNGYLYVSCSQIQKQPEYNDGVNKRTSPYTIYRIKLP